ncbi:MAG: hypothetical protein MUC36_14195 [Planctomycetes bacterium]|jgi:hypothetical protein|nr:hypothetical protein [Planctomycetota bacterium]
MQKQLEAAEARAAKGDALDFVPQLFAFGLMVGLVVNFPAWGWLLPALLALMTVMERRRRRELIKERAGESICTFARSFPRLSVDTWVIRAVWNAFHDPKLALRADDSLDTDLCIECGDVDWELVASFADRSLDSPEASQRLDAADTIADVVRLLDALPRRAAA